MPILPKCLSGFTVIPIAYPSSTHYIYARAHAKSKSKTKPTIRTEHELTLLFKHCGTVERVLFDFNSADALTEHASDSDEEMSEAAVNEEPDTEARPRKKRKLQTSEPTPPEVIPLPSPSLRTLRKLDLPRGLSHYMAKYDNERPPLDAVKAHADSFMDRFEFDLSKSKQEAKYRKGEAIVDEDGFTLVTRGGAYGQTLGGGVGVASKKFMLTGQTGSRRKKEKKRRRMCFTLSRRLKNNGKVTLLDLKKNFAADKERVEKLKESRRFKPY
ncbi:ribosomal RNA-processing protein 7-domain-containing protein [Suillus subalutaceus]|uniref:ribosomal RNA-processing protein 7-domain-containing protein n=1 Tax=Suillus subalutaceus TaxID=48586 RepID=UPI001B861D2E|nr:ribosomal RNA-processing protein 7-domain-containing protein [Suillus subalutaceus]KAG1828905.1 ribosomal RNA-processing protein 7-domain-containing protein [Suillus subalutaceus]